ncbi:ECF RNA polymerase sigma factor SigC [Corynebacterium ciconiae DSM 44920]|uniref:RNA polymerase sigma factor n=1 Tax=Corynebacterium ciconiae TaxID=227319 RepID=UPI00035F1FEC|nr:RNA polymerase sigma factor [Corynebacterium ciconiae]WKD62228.1 ECF RNA polymerase sigma factor SigC [Corynebacterium ciconiae DSM 44920]
MRPPAGAGQNERDDEHVTELALAAGRGNKAALTEFIQATQADVWRLLAHLAGRDHADDLTQETYLRVMKALPKFAAKSSAHTWLLSLARRVWVDSVRHDMARPRKSITEIDDVPRSTTPAAWSEWIDARMVMDKLSPDRREALILTQVLGYTYEEAAKIAGCRVGTIRSRVARARQDMIAATATQDFSARSS